MVVVQKARFRLRQLKTAEGACFKISKHASDHCTVSSCQGPSFFVYRPHSSGIIFAASNDYTKQFRAQEPYTSYISA